MFAQIISFIKDCFGCPDGLIPLHAPTFAGKEKEYLCQCIDSTYVSSVGPFVDEFEAKVAAYTGARHAIATVNGTAALHTALVLAGVGPGHEVLTQAISFVATANAIAYCGAEPVFLDSDPATLGLSPEALEQFLAENSEVRADGRTYNRHTGRLIAACVPMHVFGHPVAMAALTNRCAAYNIPIVEDAAEALGSTISGRHAGTLGRLGVLSFNGNKILTTGGGGMILTDDESLGKQAKHLTTTAKIPHPWEYAHDFVGFNYRLPNLNAALGCAQMEQLPVMVAKKRLLAERYRDFFRSLNIRFIDEPAGCASNFWLNAIVLGDLDERNRFLRFTNDHGVMTRPLWTLLSELPMYRHCRHDGLANARWLQERIVNIPSSVV